MNIFEKITYMKNKNLEKIAKNLIVELKNFYYNWHKETIDLANKFDFIVEQKNKEIERLKTELAKEIEKNKALRKLENRMNNMTTNVKG
ncbi:hypothetical protein [Sulfurimonas sp.]|uniref:hypothetical protein n=1 Tax=Sulfurimonas sp. TaxID=2022749 RepID=UPI003D0F3E04